MGSTATEPSDRRGRGSDSSRPLATGGGKVHSPKHAGKRRTGLARRWSGYVLILPALALLSVFSLAPFFYGAYLSLHRWDGFNPPEFVGLTNYTTLLLADSVARKALLNTGLFAAGVVVVKNVLALAMALALNRVIRGRTFFRTSVFLPVTFSIVVVGLLWSWFYSPVFGLLNETLRSIGLGQFARSWLSDPNTALLSVMIVDIWKWTGFHMVIYLAALQTLSKEVQEAARVDGAGGWRRFWYVTLPLLAPITFINVLMALSGAFVRSFDLVNVMTSGGPNHATEVVLTLMVKQAFAFGSLGYATAMGYALCAITALVSGLYLLYARGGTNRF